MPELDIETSFEMSNDNNTIFRVVVKNTSGSNIYNVEILLNRIDSIINLVGDERKLFDVIEPGNSRTSSFTLQCPEDSHDSKIGAYIIYHNQKKKNVVSILPQKISLFK